MRTRQKVKDERRCMQAEMSGKNKQKSSAGKTALPSAQGPQTPLRLLVGCGCYLRLTRLAADVEHKTLEGDSATTAKT
jgi:hypothetical protein